MRTYEYSTDEAMTENAERIGRNDRNDVEDDAENSDGEKGNTRLNQ